jgi:hypothetical protein
MKRRVDEERERRRNEMKRKNLEMTEKPTKKEKNSRG